VTSQYEKLNTHYKLHHNMRNWIHITSYNKNSDSCCRKFSYRKTTTSDFSISSYILRLKR